MTRQGPVSGSEASLVKVSNVPEEYRIIASTKCSCGGDLEPILQSLVEVGPPRAYQETHDVIRCQCTNCEKELEFTFDITDLFWEDYEEFSKKWDAILSDDKGR